MSTVPHTDNAKSWAVGDVDQYSARLKKLGLTIKDKPGVFEQVPLDLLTVDLSYQRDSTKRVLVRKLARDWLWLCCGALIVADRGDEYRVIDGGGRTEAARLRGDIQSLPCMIYEVSSIAKEADAFIQIQQNRTSVKPSDRFKAELVKGNPVAKEVDRLVKDAGRYVSPASGVNSVACIESLMSLVRQDASTVWEIWPLMKTICRNEQMPKRLLEGLFYMQRNAIPGQSLLRRPWSERMTRIGFDELLRSIQRASDMYQKGGQRVYAEGIASRLNHGLRSNVWTLHGSVR